MGKASRGKRQKELQAKSTLKDKPLKIEGISSKWSLFHKLPLHFLLIAIIGFLAYSNTFNVPFHFDDTATIVENSELKDLSNFWLPSGSRWLGFLTFALNYHFGGLNTIGYHVVNLIIHIFNAILVYWLVVLTFKIPHLSLRGTDSRSNPCSEQSLHFEIATPSARNDTTERCSRYIALFSALIFVVHPIQTQAVTYIVQRFTSLATFFYLLSLVMYIKFRPEAIGNRSGVIGNRYIAHSLWPLTYYLLSLISAILAMFTKEIAFTLPVIIMLYEFMFFKEEVKKRILYLIPLIFTMLIIPLSRVNIDKPLNGLIGNIGEATKELTTMSRWDYLFTQFRVVVTYIRLLFLPINQNVDYDYPIYTSFINPNVFLSFLLLLSIFGLGIYLLYKSRNTYFAWRLAAFGIFWFFITLSVESSIIPIRDIIFEHRVYLPSVGVFIAVTAAAFVIADKIENRGPQGEKVMAAVLIAAVILLSGATYVRNIVWQDDVQLWKDVASKGSKKARVYSAIGEAYWDQKRVEEAIAEFKNAIKAQPDYAHAYFNLGVIYEKIGRFNEAAIELNNASKYEPNDADTHYNLGIVYMKQKQFNKAIMEFQIALKIKPDFIEAQRSLAFVLELKK